jgi:hypothetical protein
MTVINAAIEKEILGMGLNEKTEATVYPSTKNRTVNEATVPGNP